MKVSPEIRGTVLALLVLVTVAQLVIVPWETPGGLVYGTGYAPLSEPFAEGATVRIGRLLLQLGVSGAVVVGWVAVTGRGSGGGE